MTNVASNSSHPPSTLATLDTLMVRNEATPRVFPFVVYILCLALMGLDGLFEGLAAMTQAVGPLSRALHLVAESWQHPIVYPILYVVQCGLVLWLLWRYRKLLPELNWRFHWLAIPTAVGLCAVWIWLGYMMTGVSPWFESVGAPGREPHPLQEILKTHPAIYYLSIVLRLVGISLVVPMFEELFVRSFCLRALHRARPTAIGLMQVLHDMPLVGEWFMHTRWGRAAAAKEGMFIMQFRDTPLGVLSVFGVAASTFVFMISHVPRDYLGCIACGVVWCALLWWTNRPRLKPPSAPERSGGGDQLSSGLGLGPIVWSHGLTNALLWGYTLYSGDWQFL